MKLHRHILTSILWICCSLSFAQDHVIHLWPHGAAGAIEDSTYVEGLATDRPNRILQVTDPTLSVYLPSEDMANGTAIIICPGGGYRRLSIGHEGFEVAEWLNELGIGGMVLKYRLPSDRIMVDKTLGPLQDVQRAIRLVRCYAKEWRIESNKIGIMGFSAGGHLAATASTLFNDRVYEPVDSVSARPDFSVLVYPVISFDENCTHIQSRTRLVGESPDASLVTHFSNELQITTETPPAFLVHSANDSSVPVENSILYFHAMQERGLPCELHIYETGGHGFGLGHGTGTETTWPEAFQVWLTMHGWL